MFRLWKCNLLLWQVTVATAEPISVDLLEQAGPTRPLFRKRMITVILQITQVTGEEELGVTWTVFFGANSKWATRSDHGNQTPLGFSLFWQHEAHHKAMMFNPVDLLEFKSHLKVLQRGLKISECARRKTCCSACKSMYLPLFWCVGGGALYTLGLPFSRQAPKSDSPRVLGNRVPNYTNV